MPHVTECHSNVGVVLATTYVGVWRFATTAVVAPTWTRQHKPSIITANSNVGVWQVGCSVSGMTTNYHPTGPAFARGEECPMSDTAYRVTCGTRTFSGTMVEQHAIAMLNRWYAEEPAFGMIEVHLGGAWVMIATIGAADELAHSDVTKPVYFLRSRKYGTEYLFGKSLGYSRTLALEIMRQRNDGQTYEIIDADGIPLERWISSPNPRKLWQMTIRDGSLKN